MVSEQTSDNELGESRSRWGLNWNWLSGRARNAEARFLSLLRFSALILAGLLLVTSVILLVLGAARQLGWTETEPKSVAVASADVAPLPAPKKSALDEEKPVKLVLDRAVRDRTLAIYKAHFKPFQRPDTKVTDEVIANFVWTKERVSQFESLGQRELLGQDGKPLASAKAVMMDALTLVEEATKTGALKEQLSAYRDAKKVQTCTDQPRTRTATVDGWDTYATHCSSWYISPIGCPSTRLVEETYVEKVCAMKFPEDLEDPAQQFANAVGRFHDAAVSKLTDSRDSAAAQTAANRARKAQGVENMVLAGMLFGGFLLVMFLYLFVALERHQRHLRALVEKS